MDELEFRRRIYANPADTDEALVQAANDDQGYDDFWQDVKRLDDKLTRAVDIHPPIEFDPYEREAHRAAAAHSPHTRQAVYPTLDGERDVLFDFVGSKSSGLCEDNHRGRVQFGKHVYGHPVNGVYGRPHHERSQYEHHRGVFEGECYEFA